MPQLVSGRTVTALLTPLIAAASVLFVTGPAHAASPLPCVSGGPSTADAQLAQQLNGQLSGTLTNAMTAYRVSCARAVVDQVKRRALPPRAAAIAVTTTIVETTIQNLDGGDRDSVGLFQQRESWGTFAQRTDPEWATDAFLNKMLKLSNWETDPIGEVCQDVQISAYPDRYQVQAGDGTIIANALWSADGIGGSISDVSGDGYADILATKPDSTLHYYSNNINSNPDNLPYISSRQIGSGWNTFNRVMSGDVSGDGYADVIATKPDGTLWYYPNNINSNPDNKPYNTGRQIGGPGWNTYNRVLLGDVSGDGYADIIATKPDGTLHYYSNNIKSNPDNLPYIGSREIGGPGWNAYNRVMIGDVSGDGYADLLATKPDGTLHYYSNNINSNPDNLPYISSREIGGPGWNAYNRVMAGDVSGDGYADLLATKPDGTLHYYSNNIKSNPNNLPYIGSREIGGPGWNSYNRVF
ncbi:FG-GAP-like repeat-containing protein [Micromonospora sp. IBSANI012]|uniref:FG-GAP-like repeat-containing protein n=1 Tax=Micromonospora sp. IBSANI012 TaxID=3457761 RepID=UPI004058AE59